MLGQLEIGRWNASYWLVSSLCENHDNSLSYKESHFFDPSPVFLFFLFSLKSSLRISWAPSLSEVDQVIQ